MLRELARKLRAIFPAGMPTGFPDEWQLLPPLTVDEHGFLVGDGVEHIRSHPSWHYAELWTPNKKPLAIVAHNTATRPGTGRNMAKRRQHRFGTAPDDRAASWHVSVDSDGTIIQQVSFLSGCWHVGSKTARMIPGAGFGNRVAVGIEMVGFDNTDWPHEQVAAAARVWRALVDAYGIKRELAMVQHSEIDPGRKTDPGKRWMRDCAPRVLEYAYAR